MIYSVTDVRKKLTDTIKKYMDEGWYICNYLEAAGVLLCAPDRSCVYKVSLTFDTELNNNHYIDITHITTLKYKNTILNLNSVCGSDGWKRAKSVTVEEIDFYALRHSLHKYEDKPTVYCDKEDYFRIRDTYEGGIKKYLQDNNL